MAVTTATVVLGIVLSTIAYPGELTHVGFRIVIIVLMTFGAVEAAFDESYHPPVL